ncbi:3-oxoacyl-[acyl-carrier protein] reductase [Granulibacter bethesdensis]|uniref:3-oxoacyl-[acyl-carrier protein] reductase n=2 Tax=Granulibacter bethesdensis TaxID=364410 RepID=Q0BTM6_GRABC|nr:3-oxoacyl-[acyl-carrier protein] reductase [Granulibacter bethesdensis CGDNIH1]AHJ66678.1 3-oxoacyl-[acyl-carrier protein] reductase [Granulibacter bethesdensis CGDNIH4]AHJ69290.1 3-oxoacyl-[acyl-carrier protein] reductase [Granulibacter bethesdensis]APH51637.1 3-oxoacyl-[acyl-carrier protein] reductase [Granulibacter bethesdensis]APH59259.1 3-oxoacyl-[acyl-carrier protein] reductase [Granulibacter bethesdensis]
MVPLGKRSLFWLRTGKGNHPMTDHSIKGKTVIIAGGAKNLGGLIARDLAAQGAKAIAIHYNSAATKADADATVAALKAAGAEAVAIQADLRTAGAVETLFNDAVAAIGRPDIAINTVGKVLKKPIVEISEAEYDEMSAVNAKSAFFFIKEAGKHLNDNGKLVTLVTSLLGAFTPFYASYAGTKAPVEHFTRAASKEFGERGISVMAIGPGPMDTPFFYGQESADAQAYHKTAAALSAFSKTGLTDIEDIVPYIRFLVSDGWWMTGQTILVNGGYTTK